MIGLMIGLNETSNIGVWFVVILRAWWKRQSICSALKVAVFFIEGRYRGCGRNERDSRNGRRDEGLHTVMSIVVKTKVAVREARTGEDLIKRQDTGGIVVELIALWSTRKAQSQHCKTCSSNRRTCKASR